MTEPIFRAPKTGSMIMAALCFLLSTFGHPLGAHAEATEGSAREQSEVPTISRGSGSFTMAGGEGRTDRTIEVFYHRPASFARHVPVIMVIPGAGRNGDEYRDAWIEASERHGVLVLSPSYSEENYPAYWSYNLGNMPESVTVEVTLTIDTNPATWTFGSVTEDAQQATGLAALSRSSPLLHQISLLELAGMIEETQGRAAGVTVNQDRSAWIWPDFDRIFAVVRDALDLEATRYDMFGHSAGGQILHRFALFHPNNHANRILAANSGWYTLPDFGEAFPYGLQDTGMSEDEIRRAFQSNLVIFLGEQDDETETRGSLRRTPQASRQGPGRLQRGQYFYREAQESARSLNAGFRWQLEIVPGVGHSYRQMGAAAAEYLYGANTSGAGDSHEARAPRDGAAGRSE